MIQHNSNGFLQFSKEPLTTPFSSLLEARVGAVPKSKTEASDNWIEGKREEFVHSGSVNGDAPIRYNLDKEWIRPWNGEKARIFVNCKTRSKTPFFCTETSMAWDGSVIGLFPTELTNRSADQNICDYLNSLDWFQLGCEDASGRKHFSVGVFQRLMLP